MRASSVMALVTCREVELCPVARLVLAARPVVGAVDATLQLSEITLGPVAFGPALIDLLILRVIDGFVSMVVADVTSGGSALRPVGRFGLRRHCADGAQRQHGCPSTGRWPFRLKEKDLQPVANSASQMRKMPR